MISKLFYYKDEQLIDAIYFKKERLNININFKVYCSNFRIVNENIYQ